MIVKSSRSYIHTAHLSWRVSKRMIISQVLLLLFWMRVSQAADLRPELSSAPRPSVAEARLPRPLSSTALRSRRLRGQWSTTTSFSSLG